MTARQAACEIASSEFSRFGLSKQQLDSAAVLLVRFGYPKSGTADEILSFLKRLYDKKNVVASKENVLESVRQMKRARTEHGLKEILGKLEKKFEDVPF